jgi:sugar/nucleoside kinase (ribokinase family)
MKILTVGGATLDVFIQHQGTDVMSITSNNIINSYMLFESGKKVEVNNVTYLTGGGATNSAVSFKRLGFDTTCFCSVGNDQEGDLVLKTLAQEGVNTSLISKSSYPTGISFIISSITGDYTIFAFRGANAHVSLDIFPLDKIKNLKYIYITSLSSESSKILPILAQHANKLNIPIAINPGVSQLTKDTQNLRDSLKYIDILILNSSEAQMFMMALIENDDTYKKALESTHKSRACGVNMSDEQPYLLHNPLLYENIYFSTRKFFTEVLKMGPKIAIVTNGCNGVYLATDKSFIFYPSMKVKIKSSVGAGDSFGSGFVASLLYGFSIEQSLIMGIANSASVLEHLGAKEGLLTLQTLKERSQTLNPSLLQRFSLS